MNYHVVIRIVSIQRIACASKYICSSQVQAERIWMNRVYNAIYLLTDNIWCRVCQGGILPLSQEIDIDICYNSQRQAKFPDHKCRMFQSGRRKRANWKRFEKKKWTNNLKAINHVSSKDYHKYRRLNLRFYPRTQINDGRPEKAQPKSGVNIHHEFLNKSSLQLKGWLKCTCWNIFTSNESMSTQTASLQIKVIFRHVALINFKTFQ